MADRFPTSPFSNGFRIPRGDSFGGFRRARSAARKGQSGTDATGASYSGIEGARARLVGFQMQTPHSGEPPIPRQEALPVAEGDRRDEEIGRAERSALGDQLGPDLSGEAAGFPIKLEPVKGGEEVLSDGERAAPDPLGPDHHFCRRGRGNPLEFLRLLEPLEPT